MICHSIFENRDCEKVIDIWFHENWRKPWLNCKAFASCPKRLVARLATRRRFRHGSAPPCRGRDRCDRCRSLRILGKPWRADGPGSIEAESHLTGVSRNGNGNGIMSTGRYHQKYLKIIWNHDYWGFLPLVYIDKPWFSKIQGWHYGKVGISMYQW